MAAALECWSGRPSTDDDAVELVLMHTHDRSEEVHCFATASSACNSSSSTSSSSSPSPLSAPLPTPNKKWQRIGRNIAGAIAALRSSLNPSPSREPSPFDRGIGRFRNAGAQQQDKLVAGVRRHFESLPNSYGQAGFDLKDVLLHMKLMEQASTDDLPAVHIQQIHDDGVAKESVFLLAFACSSPVSWPAMSAALSSSSIRCKKIQMFEKNGFTLGVVTVLVQRGSESPFKALIETSLKAAIKKPKNNSMKLSLRLCGCQEESSRGIDEDAQFGAKDGQRPEAERLRRAPLPNPLPMSSVVISIDEWQSIRSGGDDMGRWVLSSDEVELVERTGPNSFEGVYRGRRVWIKQQRGCERGSSYDIEVRQDLLQLMSCGHRNILQFHGIFFEEDQGLCVMTRMMDSGSLHDIIHKNRKLPIEEVTRIALDVAEGLLFMNDHGVAYRDLNARRILLDKQRNACLGDMGIVAYCKNVGEVTEYEMAGYRWLAPEIIGGDPEIETETWMSNVYSFGMVLWEMVSGEVPYACYSPVQVAVGIATCGLRPEVPEECPQVLRSLMHRCWNDSPAKRPQFAEIISILNGQNA
ncbi:serine/threonine/tyrosine-protein kinase HT1-like isoform X2 [Zingiber officinale]|uniref:serine/threonine/tyrosine-protein kinase HT1-like isoform X2 n=1 Tax=Zingiber officinale TaxID=94328 RepID=UPI001C4CC876|nr:serine/threonine/tyrosine-protein kinase HT1-like isoform X2 [Zingiber officinale]